MLWICAGIKAFRLRVKVGIGGCVKCLRSVFVRLLVVSWLAV